MSTKRSLGAFRLSQANAWYPSVDRIGLEAKSQSTRSGRKDLRIISSDRVLTPRGCGRRLFGGHNKGRRVVSGDSRVLPFSGREILPRRRCCYCFFIRRRGKQGNCRVPVRGNRIIVPGYRGCRYFLLSSCGGLILGHRRVLISRQRRVSVRGLRCFLLFGRNESGGLPGSDSLVLICSRRRDRLCQRFVDCCRLRATQCCGCRLPTPVGAHGCCAVRIVCGFCGRPQRKHPKGPECIKRDHISDLRPVCCRIRPNKRTKVW